MGFERVNEEYKVLVKIQKRTIILSFSIQSVNSSRTHEFLCLYCGHGNSELILYTLHFICNKMYVDDKNNIDYVKLLEKCNLLTIIERLKYYRCDFVFKALHTGYNEYIANKFTVNDKSKRHLLKIVKPKTATITRSVFYTCIQTWNSLKSKIRTTKMSLNKFRFELSQDIIESRI